jgi:aryl-alcohol dehydrogenase-like predicted oxidoreductase
MEKRRLGRTGHMSTVMIFGGASLWTVSQKEADKAIDLFMEHDVNTIDVAPSYGEAELRLSPRMDEIRKSVFLACKTFEKTKEDARDEMHKSLERLRTDKFDLYQLHAVNEISSLDERMRPGGPMEAILEAREEGLVRYVGITSHGPYAPMVQMEALRRFDFDTVMFPLNFIMYGSDAYRRDAQELLRLAREKDVGVMCIKAVARELWEDRVMKASGDNHEYDTWYKPFDDQPTIDKCVQFVLSQDVTCLPNAGEVRLLPKILDAAERYQPMSEEEQTGLIRTSGNYEPMSWLG